MIPVPKWCKFISHSTWKWQGDKTTKHTLTGKFILMIFPKSTLNKYAHTVKKIKRKTKEHKNHNSYGKTSQYKSPYIRHQP